jgi:hypothetical protein
MGDDDDAVGELAAAIGALSHGYATMLLDGSFGQAGDTVRVASDRAAAATLALLEGRRHLIPQTTSSRSSPPSSG